MVQVAVTSSNQYLTADGQDTAGITVLVTDGNTGNPLKDADVVLGVTSPWSLKETNGKTKNDGKFVTTFTPTTLSGSAVITATVTAKESTDPVVQTYTQEIVGSDPQKAIDLYNSVATVGSLTEISVIVTDKNGNPVSSKKKNNQVLFNASLSGDSALVTDDNKKVKALTVSLNASGYAVAGYFLSTRAGENYVLVTPPPPLPQALITITGNPTAQPSAITWKVTPTGNPPTLSTGNTSRFVIDYRLYDQWGNPSTNQNLSISVNTGEKMLIASDSGGNVTICYGPKANVGMYTITAQAMNNPVVKVTQTLQFLSGVPVNMLLTANPQSMASLDVNSAATATVMAKVIDNVGNPVQGETVYFSIQSVNIGTYIQTHGPSLKGDKGGTTSDTKEVSAVSDETGYAIATFTPGEFITDTKNPGFSLMASGVANVQARWKTITRNINLGYKNYPYLSVYTSVNPMTVVTNSTVEVSIVVKGDGYALKPKPVDAYLVTDRSGSMSSGNPTRMDLVKNASSAFKDIFDYSVDRLGQFSFGGTTNKFNAYATLDQALTTKPNQIDSAIKALSASGGTPLRSALYQAITELANNGNPGSVKGLVILSDGDYNIYGDPLARNTGRGSSSRDPTDSNYYYDDTSYWYNFGGSTPQNMSEYAKANNIRIYAIGYSDSLTTDGQATLRALANTTNGKYYYALTNADLVNFYGQIAGALKDTAGVNTTLALDFSGVDVNGVSKPGSSALQYMYINGKSTRVTHPDGSSETVDSTADWNKGKINVSMGTIKVNQQWVVNFTLNVTMAGNLKLLGSNSNVYFQDVNGLMGQASLPDTYVTAIPEGSDKGLSTPELTISDLGVTTSKTDMNANLIWYIDYENGKDTEIREQIEVSPLNSEAYSYVGSTTAAATDTFDTYVISTSSLNQGVYKVRVTGFVSDASSSFSITQFTVSLNAPKPSIVIQ